MRTLLGVDVGTSGCKVTAIDVHGQVCAISSTHPYPIRYPRPGWAEQDPVDWYRAVCHAIQECLGKGLNPKDVIGLSVDGPAHNVALLDADGQVLCSTIHWSDLRSIAQSERLEGTCGDRIFEVTCQRVNPSWTLSQLLWLKENEAPVWGKLRRILVTKDYVRYRLTGGYQTDRYDAIGTQLYDVANDAWSAEICDLLEFPVEWLPRVALAHAVDGEVTPQAARDTGLPVGTPVAIGSGDSVVEAFGVGAIQPGQGLVKLGSAANVNLVTERLLPSPKSLTYRHIVADFGFTITATNSGTTTLNWFRDTFCRAEMAQAAMEGISVYAIIETLVAKVQPGSEGLIFHPYLMGERSPHWDPQLRGDFVGINARHNLSHFARAMLEGVAFSIRDCLEAVEALGQPISELRLLGGGSKSQLWGRILCDVLGQPLLKPAVDDAAFGSALLAGVAVGVFANWQKAVNHCTKVEQVLQPNPTTHTRYNDYFEVYQSVTRDLREHNHHLAELAEAGYNH